jgi:DNA-nicking Smr family endonuclease
VTREIGRRNRVDYFDSKKQILECLRTNEKWRTIESVKEALVRFEGTNKNTGKLPSLESDSEWKDRNEIRTSLDRFETSRDQGGVQAAAAAEGEGNRESPENLRTPGDSSLVMPLDTRVEGDSGTSSVGLVTFSTGASEHLQDIAQGVSAGRNKKSAASDSIQIELSSEKSIEDGSEEKIRRQREATSVLPKRTTRSAGKREEVIVKEIGLKGKDRNEIKTAIEAFETATEQGEVQAVAVAGGEGDKEPPDNLTLKTVKASGEGDSSTACRKKILFDTYLWMELEKLNWRLVDTRTQRHFISPFKKECFDSIHSVLWCLRNKEVWRNEPAVKEALKTYESHLISESDRDRKQKRPEAHRLEVIDL